MDLDLFPFFNSIPVADLLFASALEFADKDVEIPDDLPREDCYRVLFALFGYQVLQRRRFRSLLIAALDEPAIHDFAARLKSAPDLPREGLANEIAKYPWRPGSMVVGGFVQHFGVTAAYLPGLSGKWPDFEILEAQTSLPPLFDYQEEVVSRLTANFGGGGRRAMVQLPTGAGKTRTAMEAIVKIRNSGVLGSKSGVLWLAHTEELCHQAVESITRVWRSRGHGELSLLRFWGNRKLRVETLPGSFLVGGYSKVCRVFESAGFEKEELLRTTGLVVIDEAHKGLAPTVRKTIEVLTSNGCLLVGLTATPGRQAELVEENRDLVELFSGNLIRPDCLGNSPVETLQSRGILAKVRYQRESSTAKISPRRSLSESSQLLDDFPTSLLRRLAKNIDRNRIITEIIEKHVKGGKSVLVFACTVNHARSLAIGLAASGIPAGFVDCEMSVAQRESVVRNFRNREMPVLLNYGVLSAGFDAPEIDVIVITRPTSSIVLYGQMIGRGLRGEAVGGTKDCLVVDVADNFSSFGGLEDIHGYFSDYWKKEECE